MNSRSPILGKTFAISPSSQRVGHKSALVEGVLDSLEAVNNAGFGDRYVSEMLDPEVDAKLNA